MSFLTLPGASFSRSSKGTARATDGSLLTYGANLPRIVPGTGLTSEGGAANLINSSNRLDDTRFWVHTNIVVTPPAADGLMRITETATAGLHRAFNGTSLASDVTRVSAAIDFRPDERSKFKLDLTDNAVGSVTVYYDAATGELTTVVGSSWSGPVSFVEHFGNGLVRVHLSAVRSAGTSATGTAALLNDAGNESYAGDPAKGAWFGRFQINAGPPTSYIETAPEATNLIVDSDMVLGADAGYVIAGTVIQSVVAGAGPQNQTLVRRMQVSAEATVRLEPSYTGGTPGSLYGGSIYIRTRDAASRVVTVEINDAASRTFSAAGTWARFDAVGSHASQPYRWIDLTLAPGDYEIAGQQIEIGPIVTPLIHTAGSAGTRPGLDPVRTADVATAGIEIGRSGTLVAEIIVPPRTGGVRAIVGDPGGIGVPLYINADHGTLSSWNGAVTLVNGEAMASGERYRIALTWEAGRRAICRTASAVVTDGNLVVAQSSIGIGCWGTGSQLNSSIGLVAALPFAVSNTQLQALTEIP